MVIDSRDDRIMRLDLSVAAIQSFVIRWCDIQLLSSARHGTCRWLNCLRICVLRSTPGKADTHVSPKPHIYGPATCTNYSNAKFPPDTFLTLTPGQLNFRSSTLKAKVYQDPCPPRNCPLATNDWWKRPTWRAWAYVHPAIVYWAHPMRLDE